MTLTKSWWGLENRQKLVGKGLSRNGRKDYIDNDLRNFRKASKDQLLPAEVGVRGSVLFDRNDYREKGRFWSDVLDRNRRDGLICINIIIVLS